MKLQVNEDGTIVFPLRNREAIQLDEPSMIDLAWVQTESRRIDDDLPPVPAPLREDDPPEGHEAAELRRKAEAERINEIYSERLPYGNMILELVHRITGDSTIEAQHLYGWAASPLTVRVLAGHFRSPLPGPEFLATT